MSGNSPTGMTVSHGVSNFISIFIVSVCPFICSVFRTLHFASHRIPYVFLILL